VDTRVKLLAAHTALSGSFPPYINASLHGDDTVVVTVRAPGYDDGRGYFVSGNDATITMKVEDFKRWLGETVSELIIANAKCDESTRNVIRKAITSAIDPPAATGQAPDSAAIAFPNGNPEG
jgi:hypothetical protein